MTCGSFSHRILQGPGLRLERLADGARGPFAIDCHLFLSRLAKGRRPLATLAPGRRRAALTL